MLYPLSTSSRLSLSLDGIWNFRLMDGSLADYSPNRPLPQPLPIAVPAAYNDQHIGRAFREHMGDMIYERTFSLPPLQPGQAALLRFGAVAHRAEVYVNGILIGTHQGGFLPFELEITERLHPGENRVTVIVNNIVSNQTLPAGRVVSETLPDQTQRVKNLPNFDFFNYTGLLRPVHLCVAPKERIEKIAIVAHANGQYSYKVQVLGEGVLRAELISPDGETLREHRGLCAEGALDPVRVWRPGDPALYALKLTYTGNGTTDEYTEPFGFRDVTVQDCRLLLNGEPIYLKGFGKHEDSPICGRGLNLPFAVKDVALMKDMHANSLRTSHYPYSEEFLRLCDREGMLVIGEAPAVGLHTGFTATGLLGGTPDGTWKLLQTAAHHRDVLAQMLERDQNHPCLVMWSVANEPASEEAGSREYFEPLVGYMKKNDPQHRPVTIVTYGGSTPDACKVAELCDVLVLNRYYGWYDHEGDLQAAACLLKDELLRFHQRCPSTPVMLGEFGADAIAGIHDIDACLFSEEYQAQLLQAYGEVLDGLPFICGEHVWNFADFATAENIKRVQGNKKGVFTRERNPKLAAHFLKRRWSLK